tara:strand:- start:41 stop:772 length:732 start_codon:yes stop_codon:yes gene_type:complete
MEVNVLTRKQLELLTYIDSYLNNNGTAPSFEEMKKAVNLKSKSGIHRLVSALEERGFLRRLPHRARALEIIKMPNSMSQKIEPADLTLPHNVIEGHFGEDTDNINDSQNKVSTTSENQAVPLYGRIAAGLPIEALRDESQTIDIPGSLIKKGEYYALEIDGDSMINAGILDGDVALIERCEEAENGTIVVALVDDNEVTLKRIRRKGESIALEPENINYETRIFGPGRVRIQGRLSGIIRSYE